MKVVGVRAWCDFDPGAAARGAVGTSFTLREYAVLSDGREVTLLDDRGWTTSAPPEALTTDHVLGSTATALLPDDAEDSGQDHEWERFAQRLREAGVDVGVDELRALPYEVVLSDRVLSVLSRNAGG